jgi:hypothetical protein
MVLAPFSFLKGSSWRLVSNSSYNVTGYSIGLQKDKKITVGGGLAGGGMMALRYLDPVILPPPPVLNAQSPTAQTSTLNPLSPQNTPEYVAITPACGEMAVVI